MLANGTILGFKKPGQENYTDLEDLKTVPDIGSSPEMVENTPLRATSKRYEAGIGDLGTMEYTFVYDGNSKNSTYRVLRPYADKHQKLEFQETWTDGTKFQYTAIPSLSFTRGGGINGVVDLKVSMAICSDIEVIDPEEIDSEETDPEENNI